jgi:hypothetical protein
MRRTVRRMLQTLSWMALAGTLLPAILYVAGVVTLSSVKAWMLAATIVWFVTTPLWMDRQEGA